MTTGKKILYVLYLLLVLELTLRAQQRFGPIYDLEFRHVSMDTLSDELNHLPTYLHDELGIREDPLDRPAENAVKVLFMGDSFMQGLDSLGTIPVYVRDYLERNLPGTRPVRVFNAGVSSYSPSIFIPQARKIIPRLKPDIVVIDVDATDIFDDFFRYRPLVVRDETGRIAAVARTPRNDVFTKGFLEIRKQPLYLARFVLKLWHTRVRMPRVPGNERLMKDLVLLVPALDEKEARLKHAEQIRYFEGVVDELLETAVSLAGPGKVLVCFHPHLGHLPDKAGRTPWNGIIQGILEDAARRRGAHFYDATADLAEDFGKFPERYYFPNDMHFNRAGLRVYAVRLARKLAPLVGSAAAAP